MFISLHQNQWISRQNKSDGANLLFARLKIDNPGMHFYGTRRIVTCNTKSKSVLRYAEMNPNIAAFFLMIDDVERCDVLF